MQLGLLFAAEPHRAPNEPTFQTPSRNNLDHRHFLGHAHRLVAIGDGIAKDQQARFLGLPRKYQEQQRRSRIDAYGRLVMLVDHDVQTALVGDQALV